MPHLSFLLSVSISVIVLLVLFEEVYRIDDILGRKAAFVVYSHIT